MAVTGFFENTKGLFTSSVMRQDHASNVIDTILVYIGVEDAIHTKHHVSNV